MTPGGYPEGTEHRKDAPWNDDHQWEDVTYYCNLCGINVVEQEDETCHECQQHIADTAPPEN